MADFIVVGDYEPHPSEGMQVISKTLVDGLRAAGHTVQVVPPRRMSLWLVRFVITRPGRVVFTHGPGTGVVLWSALLRILTRARVIWVATRPDLRRVPALLTGRRTAHVVIGNSPRPEFLRCAPEARFSQKFIGIDPERLGAWSSDAVPWPELAIGVPTALHVGHLRHNRGLDLLVEAKRRMGDRAQVVVLGSPTFPPDPGVVEELVAAGVVVHREFIGNLAALYGAVDLYLFPVRSEAAGAIDLPLGVLEAVACGTPVVSTPFGSLTAALADVPGVRFAEPGEYADAVVTTLLVDPASRQAPDGLPESLHAQRVTAAVLDAAGVTS
ncbi:glycosyltransferase family 4 protein [Streptomyces sp. 061-3]|uniref:glycosyltransferase family 4 protein n=1 Tax=Streptomyces sp. 061-3 TaxID=2789268 RepID=UPI003980CCF0